jgi:hypothetical protein
MNRFSGDLIRNIYTRRKILFFPYLVKILSPNIWCPQLFLGATMGRGEVALLLVEINLIPITVMVYFVLS